MITSRGGGQSGGALSGFLLTESLDSAESDLKYEGSSCADIPDSAWRDSGELSPNPNPETQT